MDRCSSHSNHSFDQDGIDISWLMMITISYFSWNVPLDRYHTIERRPHYVFYFFFYGRSSWQKNFVKYATIRVDRGESSDWLFL
jgi:hypothetical protein